jgi:hypothetical protein
MSIPVFRNFGSSHASVLRKNVIPYATTIWWGRGFVSGSGSRVAKSKFEPTVECGYQKGKVDNISLRHSSSSSDIIILFRQWQRWLEGMMFEDSRNRLNRY